MTRSDRLFAAVDGGGTKTVVVIVDESGREVARHRSTTSNAAIIGHAAAAQTLRAAVEAALALAPSSGALSSIWFGLSGSDQREDHDRLRPDLDHLCDRIRMSNDAELALGGLPGTSGVAIVSGTGSIAFGLNHGGERARAGGWGHMFGDQGSGYGIARDLCRTVSREIDGTGPTTSLTPRLLDHLGLARPHHLIHWIYATTTTKGDIAALASLAFAEARAGDDASSAIVESAARELADIGTAAGRKLGFADHLPVALTGGLLVNEHGFRHLVVDRLRLSFPSVESVVIRDPALTAAQSLAAASRA